MLEVTNLSRSYGSFLAVDQVNFVIQNGEIVGLLGHNGAGKTTIMKMLSGFLEPDKGSIIFDGLDLAQRPKQVQKLLGYLPENLPVYPEMTVADYLDYAADLKGLQGDLKVAEVRRAVKATELAEKIHAPIATLSRGFKQRVGVAQAILGKPRMLILDEPTNGLDPTQTEHMRQLIRDIAKSATVILSTHIMQEVDALCDRVLIVNAGQLVLDEKLANLKQASQLELVTTLPYAELQKSLSQINAVQALANLNNINTGNPLTKRYRIDLKGDTDIYAVASQCARAVIAHGGELMELAPVIRNLETLFREVSSGTRSSNTSRTTHASAPKEASHAA
jgi:ABC-2 type transport system ATP-binding protein